MLIGGAWSPLGASHDLVITVLEYMRHVPIKKLKPLCANHTNKLQYSMGIDLKMNCCLLN